MSTPKGAEPAKESRLKYLLNHPLSTYYLIGGSSVLLLLLGLVMVLSASSIESFKTFGSSYTLFGRQALFGGLGLVGMYFAARTSIQFWRGIAKWLFVIAVVLLLAVLVIGVSVAGQKNWIDIVGPFRLQPSEFAKIALVVWGSDQVAKKLEYKRPWKELLYPILPVAIVFMVLVLAEGDFGNTLLLAAILCGMLFAAGIPGRFFAGFAGVLAVGTLILSIAAPYRMARFTSWLDPNADPLGTGWQLTQGQYALGTGGVFGVGLGASREKWGALPEAHTDFIFSVIGEELGLIGTFSVLILFAVLAFAIFRLSRTSKDNFVRIATAGVGVWIVFQAITNIGAVLGLLPITGVPLPFVSYGGSSLVPTLGAIGMLLCFARNEPGARQSLRRRQTARSLARR